MFKKKAIACPTLKFIYVDAPKCASTSLKRWIYKIEFGKTFERYKQDNRWIHVHNCSEFRRFSFPQLPEAQQDYQIVTVIRDPIKRLLSAYSNRIVNFKELGEQTTYSDRIKAENLKFNPNVNYFIRNLEAYQNCTNKAIILHHTRPIIDFIGEDLSLYTNIYPMENLKQIKSDLLASSNCATPEQIPEIPKTQTGGPKLKLNRLKQKNFDKLIEYYAQDYKLLKDYYSVEKITQEYQESVNS